MPFPAITAFNFLPASGTRVSDNLKDIIIDKQQKMNGVSRLNRKANIFIQLLDMPVL